MMIFWSLILSFLLLMLIVKNPFAYITDPNDPRTVKKGETLIGGFASTLSRRLQETSKSVVQPDVNR
jgi:hypothetical protein